MMRTLLTCMAVISSLLGCKSKLNIAVPAGYVIGPTDDIKPYSKDSSVSPDIFRAAVLIATNLAGDKVKFCSGILVHGETISAAPRVVTNHHCFANTDDEGNVATTLVAEACVRTKVYFTFAPSTGAVTTVQSCKQGSLRTTRDADLAVFTLDGNAPQGYTPLTLWPDDAINVGRKVVIVHYPDMPSRAQLPPGGTIKLPTASETTENCEVLGYFPRNEWELDPALRFSMRHTCDLIHGSSGSALVDVATKKILGINWGGIKIGPDAKSSRTDNGATRAIFVSSYLNGVTPTTQSLGVSVAAVGQEPANDAVKANKDSKKTSMTKRLGHYCGVILEKSNKKSKLRTSTNPALALFLLCFPVFICLTPMLKPSAWRTTPAWKTKIAKP